MTVRLFRRASDGFLPGIAVGPVKGKKRGRHTQCLLAVAVFVLITGALSVFWTVDLPRSVQTSASMVADVTEVKPGDAYIDSCRTNEVPIPPDWPDDRWIERGRLPFVFAEFPDAKTTDVFTYEDPDGKGVCYALVRKNHNKWYEAVGIICQSRSTGKACFWDNVIPGEKMDNRIRGTEIKLDIRSIGNGSNMRERCTDCHRGESVFLIHPGTPLAAIEAHRPNVRYSPIGQVDWENPEPMEKMGDGPCSQCHELAAPTERYCGLLKQAAEKTMPPGPHVASWDDPRPEFKAAIDKIKAHCAALGD